MEEVLEDELRTQERRTGTPVEPGENTQDTGRFTAPKPHSPVLSLTPNSMLWFLTEYDVEMFVQSGTLNTFKHFQIRADWSYKAREGNENI